MGRVGLTFRAVHQVLGAPDAQNLGVLRGLAAHESQNSRYGCTLALRVPPARHTTNQHLTLVHHPTKWGDTKRQNDSRFVIQRLSFVNPQFSYDIGKPLFTHRSVGFGGKTEMSRGIIFNKERQFVNLPGELKQALVQGAEPYPIPENKQYEYGTAGVSLIRGSHEQF